jgi:hypothetical protein
MSDTRPKISWEAQENIDSWCRILDQTKGDKRPIFERDCVELLRLAESHADPAARQAIIDALYDMAVAAWISDDEAQAIMSCSQEAQINGAMLNGIQLDDPRPKQWADDDEAHLLDSLGEHDAGDDIEAPPPRGSLLANTFCRRFLSSLLGDGGVGKTALRYTQYLSLAIGRSLTGEHVFQRARVLVISLEDDTEELQRRILKRIPIILKHSLHA